MRWNGERGCQHSLGWRMEAGDVSTHYVVACRQGISALTVGKDRSRGYQHSFCGEWARDISSHYVWICEQRIWALSMWQDGPRDISTHWTEECGQEASVVMLPHSHNTHTHTHISKVYYFPDTILLVQGMAKFRIRLTHSTFIVIMRRSLSRVVEYTWNFLTTERLWCKKSKHKFNI